MAKRGRPIKEDAKRNVMHVRLNREENDMLHELSVVTGKTRSEILVDSLKKIYSENNMSVRVRREADLDAVYRNAAENYEEE